MVHIFCLTKVATVLVVAVVLVTTSVSSDDQKFLFTSNRLPAKAVRPTLANGNLGFVVYGDAVHMNGVYNGLRGLSHRARIPNYANLQITDCAESIADPIGCTYQLDMQNNMFRTVYEDSQQNYRIVHEVFPNRFFDMTIVNKIRLQRMNSQNRIQVNILRNIEESVDISMERFQMVNIGGEMFTYVCGKTNQVEDERYQQYGHDVCIYFSEVPLLTLEVDQTAEEYLIYTVFARSTIEAEHELLALKRSNVVTMHTREQQRIWEKYGITVDGNDALDRVLKASSFYLSSSLPSMYTNQVSSYPFYGLSPSGLGRGGEELKEYQGHSFWDTEMWMFPPILLMDPHNARRLLHYRTVVQKAAVDRAAENGYDGWMFPWESAFTGTETTPECCPEVVEFQHHITADIAYAAKQYFYATEDVDWMRSEGCHLAYQTAKFWHSRAEYNNLTDLYEIHRVMGPDEDNHNVSNNPFTNVVAAHNLMFGDFAGCLCEGIVGATREERAQFIETAKALTLLHDDEIDFSPQFEGYKIGTWIKQADVVLLSYPLEYPLNGSTKANNLEIYSNVTRPDGPAMTWAMHTIGHLDLGQMAEAEKMFTKSYEQYMRAPFYVWSENGDGSDGAGNFITGAGGFLQSVINGYAGVRLRNGELEIKKPLLLPGTTRLFIPEINFLNVKFSLEVTNGGTTIGVKFGSMTTGVKLFVDEQERELCTSCSIHFNNTAVFRTSNGNFNGCKLLNTNIGIKVADQASGATRMQLATILVKSLLGMFLFQMLI